MPADSWTQDLNKWIMAVVASVAAWFCVQHAPQRVDPAPIVHPAPQPRKPLIPRPWHRDAKVGGDVAPDGTPVQVDLPQNLRMHNTGGRDGAGLCVFTSINHAALWQDVKILQDFQRYMTHYPGGGYPEKVDAMIARKCKEAGVAVPQYVQVEGSDLDLIDMALKTGRMASITYGYSPSGRYGGQLIDHMVNCAHADGKNYAVLDNNHEQQLEWLSRAELQDAYTTTHDRWGRKMNGGGWTFVLLNPGPPPVPRNKK